MRANKNVIILHGWASNPDRWQQVAESLKKKDKKLNINVYAPFLPGFDSKHPLEKAYDIVDYAGWVKKYLIQKKISNPILIGHSNGGRIAIYLAAHNSNLIDKLVLIGAAGIPPRNNLKVKISRFIVKIIKRIAPDVDNRGAGRLIKKYFYRFIGAHDYLNASPIMKKTMQSLLRYDSADDLPRIKCKTLCIWGRDDKSTPLWMGKLMSKLLKNAELIIFEGGHNIHKTHPDKLVITINKFITE